MATGLPPKVGSTEVVTPQIINPLLFVIAFEITCVRKINAEMRVVEETAGMPSAVAVREELENQAIIQRANHKVRRCMRVFTAEISDGWLFVLIGRVVNDDATHRRVLPMPLTPVWVAGDQASTLGRPG